MHLVKPQETLGIGHIMQEMEEDFEALTCGEYDNFELVSCFVNGEPTVAIAVVEEDRITPLFISITPTMVLTDHNGNELEHDEPENAPDDDDDENYND